MIQKPELLAPAGNMEKLKSAHLAGANAVYVGGHLFGLRQFADNFSKTQLTAAIQYCKQHGVACYVVLNGYAHDNNIHDLKDYVEWLDTQGPSAVIVADLGVASVVKSHSSIPIHVSTQASITNVHGCRLWMDKVGATRIILAREVSLKECRSILDQVSVELEVFVHGAMCASYSGKCVISNYSSGRDSNRGGCIQSCRHDYQLKDYDTKDQARSAHIMNATDLMGIAQLPELIRSGICSCKIEGRMKSNLYVSNAVSVYRQAIDAAYDHVVNEGPWTDAMVSEYEADLSRVSNRSFSSGGLESSEYVQSVDYEFTHYRKSWDLMGVVKETLSNNEVVVQVKQPFSLNDDLILRFPDGRTQPLSKLNVTRLNGQHVDKVHPNWLVKLSSNQDVHWAPLSLLVKACS